jgi:hypothetical protein
MVLGPGMAPNHITSHGLGAMDCHKPYKVHMVLGPGMAPNHINSFGARDGPNRIKSYGFGPGMAPTAINSHGFGARDCHKPYEFRRVLGPWGCPTPYKFIRVLGPGMAPNHINSYGFVARMVPNQINSHGFVARDGPKPYIFIWFWCQ